jgi:hypothetical protein
MSAARWRGRRREIGDRHVPPLHPTALRSVRFTSEAAVIVLSKRETVSILALDTSLAAASWPRGFALRPGSNRSICREVNPA